MQTAKNEKVAVPRLAIVIAIQNNDHLFTKNKVSVQML